MNQANNSIDLEAFEFFDSLKFYTSEKFLKKYRMKYSEMLIEAFQKQLVSCLQKRKPVTLFRLSKRLITNTGLSEEVVNTFLEEIDALDELYPIILRKRK